MVTEAPCVRSMSVVGGKKRGHMISGSAEPRGSYEDDDCASTLPSRGEPATIRTDDGGGNPRPDL